MNVGVAKNIGMTAACLCMAMLFACSDQDEQTPRDLASVVEPPAAEELGGETDGAPPASASVAPEVTSPAVTGPEQWSDDNGGLNGEANIDQILLTAMREISRQQTAATEKDSADELQQLSEADRKALQDITAQQTMVDAEEKASLQAQKNEASSAEQQRAEDPE